MTIARHYTLHAKEGQDAVMETLLRNLLDVVVKIPGSQGVELLRDLGNERRFVFIEKWDSVEAHKEGGKLIDKSVFGPLIEAMDGPMEGAYLDYLYTV